MIDAAWEVLQQKGCEATTVNDIIARSGGSRATLYEAFGGKDGLLEAAVAERCSAFSESMQLMLDDQNAKPHRVLEMLAEAFLVKVFAPESICTLGIFVTEGARFPHMVDAFLKHGPRQLVRRVAAYLEAATRAGKLQVEDPELAADLFLAMLQGQWVLRVMVQNAPPPSPEDLRKRARLAVSIFLEGLASRGPA